MEKRLILAAALCFSSVLYSQLSLTKDASYGTNGTIDFTVNNSNDLVWNRHYVTSDNYVVICPLDAASNANFMTYDANGTLLSTITLPAQGDASVLYADSNTVYPVADGKLYKYSINGSADPSFGNNGELLIGSNFSATNYSTASYLSDGKILVRNQDSFTRFNANGAVDISYGNNGTVNITAASPSSSVLNEGINSTYFFENSGGRRKINVNTGALDVSYGNNGYSVYSNQSGYVPFDPEAVTNNFEIFTLLFKNGSSFDYALSKTKNDGNIDNAFGNSGIVSLPQTFNNKVLYYGLTMGMDDYNNNVFLPLTVRQQQGDDTDAKVGFSCYAAAGNLIKINGSDIFESDIPGNSNNISVEVKGNYLYLFTQTSVSRYIISGGTLNLKERITDYNQIHFNNPFSSEIILNSKEKIKQIEIYDGNGRLMLKEKGQDRINTIQLNTGIYLIKFITESNKIISRQAIKN